MGFFEYLCITICINLVLHSVNFNLIGEKNEALFSEFYASALQQSQDAEMAVPAELKGLILPYLEMQQEQAREVHKPAKVLDWRSRPLLITEEPFLSQVCLCKCENMRFAQLMRHV